MARAPLQMTPMRYVLGAIWVCFVGLSVAVMLSLFQLAMVLFIFGERGSPMHRAIGPLGSVLVTITPGIILGLFAARRSWRARVARAMRLEHKKQTTTKK